jgi:hypothetical protein
MDVGRLVDDLALSVIIANDEKSGDLATEPQTPRPHVEIHICPICLHPCEGAKELMEHYWGYCQKTRNYFDTMMTVGE